MYRPPPPIREKRNVLINAGLGSLRIRLLVPLIGASLLIALVIALSSYWLGAQWARQDVSQRYEGIRNTLEASTFPLTPSVLRSLADLTQTQLVAMTGEGDLVATTFAADSISAQHRQAAVARAMANGDQDPSWTLQLAGREYLSYVFRRERPLADRAQLVWVLFDETQLRSASWRAASLPLVTGLSTVILLSSLALLMTGRLIRRLVALQDRVERVAGGDFDSKVSDEASDEVGRLGRAVDTMAGQLKQLWVAVNRQQREKLLHQISGGMAHQLRNSLTGSRMAVELHAKHCREQDDEGLKVAIQQMDQAEAYIKRLLLVGSGTAHEDQPAAVMQTLADVQSSLRPVAHHLHVDVAWDLAESLERYEVADGPTLAAAASNLILNAMQAARKVWVRAVVSDHRMQLTVSDDGEGIAEEIAAELFEPFVSTKPQGLGLGLSVVRRAAERLGGDVRWRREHDRTTFELCTAVAPGAEL